MATNRYHWGDLRLWHHGKTHIVEDAPTVEQVFQGVDRTRALIVPGSSNDMLSVEVRTLGMPNANALSQAGVKTQERAMRAAIRARRATLYPLAWTVDDTTVKAVGSFSTPTVTCVAHGRSTSDVVLIRRAGAGLYSLATVTYVDADNFTVAAVTGTSLHAIAASDEIHLVEWYLLGCRCVGMSPVTPTPGKGEWFAPDVAYRFMSSGQYEYSRTTATAAL